ncbi:MAG TPA: hypothetical protein VNX28_03905, partial [Gemmataceae bacterium]|nr:hypothetical protein [Gemmataceae bacterium]
MPFNWWITSLDAIVRGKRSAHRQPSRKRHTTHARLELEELENRLVPAVGITGGTQQLLQAYGQLPISFEANAGQTDAQVQYLAHGGGYALFLTSTSAVLTLNKAPAAAADALGAGLLTPP